MFCFVVVKKDTKLGVKEHFVNEFNMIVLNFDRNLKTGNCHLADRGMVLLYVFPFSAKYTRILDY